MSSKVLMRPDTSSLSGLLTNGITYEVPTFQRDYSWGLDNWIDLWEDIKVMKSTDKEHYMGAVVVQKKGDKKFLIIDGQQRFTTLSILALAIIKNIQDLIEKNEEPDENKERINELRRSFLGQRDPGSLMYSSKLKLNENNDFFYQSKLLQLEPPISERILSDSDKLLWKTLNYFYAEVKNYFEQPTGEQLANFLSKIIGDKMMFIRIEVEDELSAYTLFETLNYRGVDLTVTDLLKNYLFSLLSEIDIQIAKDMWKRISTTVGLEKFPTFLRHYWISKNPLVRQEQLFKVIRFNIKSNKDVFELLRNLEGAALVYVALQDHLHSEWRGNRERIKRIRELTLFGVKQQLPLLMIAKAIFNDAEYDKLLKLVSVISFRYNIIGSRQANRMEELYNIVCQRIFRNEITTTAGVFTHIKDIYIQDDDFVYDFTTIQMYSYGSSRKLVRYILFELENLLMQGGDRDYEGDPATIEHILPEHPNEEWNEYFPQSIEENYIYRLGNYTLLEDHLNNKCGDSVFEHKKEHYRRSQYELSKRLNVYEWLPSTLDARQRDMANWAKTIWRVPYAD